MGWLKLLRLLLDRVGAVPSAVGVCRSRRLPVDRSRGMVRGLCRHVVGLLPPSEGLLPPVPAPLPSPDRSKPDGGARGWLAVGLLFGLTDASAAARLAGSSLVPVDVLVLLAVGVVTGWLVAGVGGGLLALVVRAPVRPPWVAFVGGAAALLAADLGLLRLTALGGVGLIVGLLAGGLVAWTGARLQHGPPRPRLLFGLGLIALLAIRSSPRRAPTAAGGPLLPTGPSVILVSVDGLRADLPLDLQPAPMPVLSSLMDEGIRYTRAFTPEASWEGGRRALLEGRVPWSTGAEGLALGPTLQGLGWRTAAVPARTGAAVGDAALPVAGFGELLRPGMPLPALEHTMLGGMLDHPAVAPGPSDAAARPASEGVELAMDWLERQPGASAVWLHLEEPRAPFLPPPPWDEAWYQGDRYDSENTVLDEARARGELPAAHDGIRDPDWLRAAWTGELATVDAALGVLMARARAMPEPPLVVVAGTAGMPLGAEGRWVDPSGLTAPPASGVGLVLWWPGVLAEGATLGAPVSLVDVGPTVCALLVRRVGGGLACPPAGRLLPRAVDGAGLRAAASTQGADGVGTRHTPLHSERITASGARERWVSGSWQAVVDEP